MRTLRRSFILHELWGRTMELTQDLHASPRLAWDVTERLLVRVTEILDRNRLTHIDLGPALSRRIAALLDPATQHWTPEGHRAVADAGRRPEACRTLKGRRAQPSPPRSAVRRALATGTRARAPGKRWPGRAGKRTRCPSSSALFPILGGRRLREELDIENRKVRTPPVYVDVIVGVP